MTTTDVVRTPPSPPCQDAGDTPLTRSPEPRLVVPVGEVQWNPVSIRRRPLTVTPPVAW
ncbi:hypothetical protein ACH4U6_12020 [Streptomyces netropsis]|uniref:Uncharacterized protein n=1 Tax=Streptomyces netropsis TaxID=55404 RepID=A0A7W7PHK0_STRNE|nr:hypothetical protein [Streptomyces netropsis]GGR43828.1 hypothetical protein GCM10010219_56730 [Streptomyces netropsis]